MPLAVVSEVNTGSPNLYFVHADHINRPIRMTNGAKAVVWDAFYKPFGEVISITGSASNNLRFPGQYFLIESGLHYNWYRHYDPTIGRYVQADPLPDMLLTQPKLAWQSALPLRPELGTQVEGREAKADAWALNAYKPTRNGEPSDFADGPDIYTYARSAPTTRIDDKGLLTGNFTPIPKPPSMVCNVLGKDCHAFCTDRCVGRGLGSQAPFCYWKCMKECRSW